MDLQKLTDGGWLRKIGDGPQTRYAKTSKKMPDNAGQEKRIVNTH